MKKLSIIIAITAFLPYCAISQDIINDFQLTENKAIYWQNVSETKLIFDQLFEKIVESGNFENIDKFDNKVICKLKPYKSNYKMHGYSTMRTPFYISRNLIEANVVFDYKEGRYRTTIRNIQFIQNINDLFSMQGEIETFESWVLNKKGSIKMNFFKDGSDILNKDFRIKTTFTEPKNEKW